VTDVRGIVSEFLKANGYDGLVNTDAECGCAVADMMDCLGACDGCEPAYRWTDCRSCAVVAGDGYCEWEGDGCYRTLKPEAAP
jgi:hypothetical protein